MISHKNRKDGFLKLPNVLMDRILKSDLTGVELKVLLLCLRWTVGYRKEICTPTLTALERETGHARKFVSRVLRSLVDKRFLQLVKASGFRQPAQYRVPLQWDSPTRVGQPNASNTIATCMQQARQKQYSITTRKWTFL